MANLSEREARNHHFVPQFYLKGFATQRSQSAQLVAFDLEKATRFVTRPRNVAARRDYNRIDVTGVDPNILEKELSKWEHARDQAFRRVISGQRIDGPNDLEQIISLLARLFLSNPAFREQRSDFMRQATTVLMHDMVSSEARWNGIVSRARNDGVSLNEETSYEEAQKAVINKEIIAETARETLIHQELELWPKITPLLEKRQWTLVLSNANTGEFATCDRPAIIFWDNPILSKTIYSPGLGCTGTTILFPLSRWLCLVGKFGEGGGRLSAVARFVASTNLRILAAASRQIYCSSDFPIFQADGSIAPFSRSEVWLQQVARRQSV